MDAESVCWRRTAVRAPPVSSRKLDRRLSRIWEIDRVRVRAAASSIARGCRRGAGDPSEAHARLATARVQSPIGLGPYGPEILRYREVHTVLRDPRFVNPRGLGLEAQGITSGPVWDRATASILAIDGHAHTRLRRLVAKAFSPRAVARLQTLVAQTASGLVDALAEAGSGDFVTDVARPYPTPIICGLLGAPPQDWNLFSAWADAIMKIFDWNVAGDGPVIAKAWDELDAYLEAIAAQRRTTPTYDLISELIRAEDDGDRLSHSELLMLVTIVAQQLLSADFRPLAAEWLASGRAHAGLILLLSARMRTRAAVQALAAALQAVLSANPEGIAGSEQWIGAAPNF